MIWLLLIADWIIVTAIMAYALCRAAGRTQPNPTDNQKHG